ncbi:tetratricopeptide repeat protein [Streptomyces chartreusis]
MITPAAFDEIYQELEAETKDIYRALGLLPIADVDAPMTAAVCRLSWGRAGWSLEVLAEQGLLKPLHGHEDLVRYRLLPAARDHAKSLAVRTDPEQDRQAVLRRLCQWILATSTHLRSRLTPAQATQQDLGTEATPICEAPFDDDAEALAWLESIETGFLDVLATASAAGWDDIVWQLVDAFGPLFLRRHPYDMSIAAHKMGLDAARRTSNKEAIQHMLMGGATGLSSAGQLDTAIDWYRQALTSARQWQDAQAEGEALLGLASCDHQAGRPDEALLLLAEATNVWRRCDYRRGIALATLVFGEIVLVDDPPRALSLFAWARGLLLEAEASYDAARALVLQGHSRVVTGESGAGIQDLEMALSGLADVTSARWRARCLELLGAAWLGRGQRDEARACFAAATDLYAGVSRADSERLRAVWSGL